MMDVMLIRGESPEYRKTSTGAFPAPPPRVRQMPGKSVSCASDAPTKPVFQQDSLDTEWEILSAYRPDVVVTSPVAGATRRAFFFSKLHAKCVSMSRDVEVLCQGII